MWGVVVDEPCSAGYDYIRWEQEADKHPGEPESRPGRETFPLERKLATVTVKDVESAVANPKPPHKSCKFEANLSLTKHKQVRGFKTAKRESPAEVKRPWVKRAHPLQPAGK